MSNYLNRLTLYFVLVFSFLGAHCSDTPLGTSNGLNPFENLIVIPSSEIKLGYSDEVTFDVYLEDDRGNAIIGAPIIVSFVGDSANASLDPATFHTSEQGSGRVTFVAPDRDVAFAIRFRSPEDETSVEVVVDPSLFSVTLDVDYTGNREMEELEATLFRDIRCSELAANEGSIVRTYSQSSDLPTSLFVDGLRAETTYAIELTAKNRLGRTRALGCVDDISASNTSESVALQDAPLDFAGKYTTTIHLGLPGLMDIIVDRLAENISFISAPETAIMDGIRTVLTDDQFSVETFDQQREEQSLDRGLRDDIERRNIDVSAVMAPTWEDMKGALDSFDFIGTLELESSEDEEFNLHHTLERLKFYQDDDTELEITIRMPDTGDGTARVEPFDTLVLMDHEIILGLGVPLSSLFATALSDNLGTQEISQALLNIVDCGAVADYLEPLLADVTTRSVLLQGCQLATETAEEQLNAEITELNQFNQLTLSATCEVEVPLVNEQVGRLFSDNFHVVWGNEEADFYKMDDLPFEASYRPLL